jgi:murein DD-endopeptidase MepM/ murein hydrolase activator NlpD
MSARATLVLALAACGPTGQGAEPMFASPMQVRSAPKAEPSAAQRADTWSSEYTMMEYAGGRLRVRLDRTGDRVVESVANEYRVAVTIDPTRTTTNLREVRPPAATVTIPAGATVAIAEWTLVDPTLAWTERSHFRHEFGDPAAQPDGYIYALPFARGESFPVGQGPGGSFSHTGDSFHAVDFTMPEGTVVRAARDGIVVATHDAATTAGVTEEFRTRARANWIYILHADGTLGVYWHLAPGGVGVEPGQKVARGDEIGRSGFTGYAQVPHLHFAVARAETGARARTFPFVFRTSKRDKGGSPPVEHETYAAFE